MWVCACNDLDFPNHITGPGRGWIISWSIVRGTLFFGIRLYVVWYYGTRTHVQIPLTFTIPPCTWLGQQILSWKLLHFLALWISLTGRGWIISWHMHDLSYREFCFWNWILCCMIWNTYLHKTANLHSTTSPCTQLGWSCDYHGNFLHTPGHGCHECDGKVTRLHDWDNNISLLVIAIA